MRLTVGGSVVTDKVLRQALDGVGVVEVAVDDYIQHHRPRAARELQYFKVLRSDEEAIARAALAQLRTANDTRTSGAYLGPRSTRAGIAYSRMSTSYVRRPRSPRSSTSSTSVTWAAGASRRSRTT
jgi:hypothetical protein